MIGEKFNFEDVFFRDLTVCVLDTMEGQIQWVNRFTSGDYVVNVPIYYSMTGDERFLLDSFSDDIVSDNRYVELNTDVIPRGHLTLTGFNVKSEEFANPNVWLRMVVENEKEMRKVISRVRAVPISVNYELTILLSSEVDSFKCSQAILNTLWLYKYMYFEFNFMNIDAILTMPDNNQIEMSRDKNLTSDNSIKLKASFTVDTYYPAFREERYQGEGYLRESGSGMRDMGGYVFKGSVSDFFETKDFPSDWNDGQVPKKFPLPSRPDKVPTIGDSPSPFGFPDSVEYGATGSFGNPNSVPGGSGTNGSIPGSSQDSVIVPKRSRWFNEILKSRERNSGR
jgi:hypothetical protein